MIKSFKNKSLKVLFDSNVKKGIDPKQISRVLDILDLLNAAVEIKDLNFPGAKLHQLKGNYLGYWSIRVSGNWRIVFQFVDGDVFNVDYLDYH